MQPRAGLGGHIARIRKQIALREGRPITLDEFGRRVAEREQRAPGDRPSGEIAYPKATVSRWERGVQIPRESTLRAIAELGEISVDDLAAEVADPRRADLLAARLRRPDAPAADANPDHALGPNSDSPEAPVDRRAVWGLAERQEHAYSPVLLAWLYRLLADLAEEGAGRLACALAEYWLTRLIVVRAADPALEGVADDVVLLVWGEMAGTVRHALWERGLLGGVERPPAPEPDPLDALGRRRELTYPERRTLALLGVLARPTGFGALLDAVQRAA